MSETCRTGTKRGCRSADAVTHLPRSDHRENGPVHRSWFRPLGMRCTGGEHITADERLRRIGELLLKGVSLWVEAPESADVRTDNAPEDDVMDSRRPAPAIGDHRRSRAAGKS